jgi:hypothetical protein
MIVWATQIRRRGNIWIFEALLQCLQILLVLYKLSLLLFPYILFASKKVMSRAKIKKTIYIYIRKP